MTKAANFRLPLKGIYARHLESRLNLYHRQIALEEVSTEQSQQRLESILESLMKMNKLQEAEVVRRFIIVWLGPLTEAIATEQEMKARVAENKALLVLAEADVPLAMADAFRAGNLYRDGDKA